jgi:hypothetical protein
VVVPFLKGYAAFAERRVTDLLDSVKASTRFLEDLVREFTSWYGQRDQPCHLAVFYETKESNLLRKGFPSWLADRLKKPKLVSSRLLIIRD